MALENKQENAPKPQQQAQKSQQGEPAPDQGKGSPVIQRDAKEQGGRDIEANQDPRRNQSQGKVPESPSHS